MPTATCGMRLDNGVLAVGYGTGILVSLCNQQFADGGYGCIGGHMDSMFALAVSASARAGKFFEPLVSGSVLFGVLASCEHAPCSLVIWTLFLRYRGLRQSLGWPEEYENFVCTGRWLQENAPQSVLCLVRQQIHFICQSRRLLKDSHDFYVKVLGSCSRLCALGNWTLFHLPLVSCSSLVGVLAPPEEYKKRRFYWEISVFLRMHVHLSVYGGF